MILEAVEQDHPRGNAEAIGSNGRGLDKLVGKGVDGSSKVVPMRQISIHIGQEGSNRRLTSDVCTYLSQLAEFDLNIMLKCMIEALLQ